MNSSALISESPAESISLRAFSTSFGVRCTAEKQATKTVSLTLACCSKPVQQVLWMRYGLWRTIQLGEDLIQLPRVNRP